MFKCIVFDKLFDKLIDTEFECDIPVLKGIYIAIEIAKEYEKRNLNVAANLALYFDFIYTETGYSFNVIKNLHYENQPELSKVFYNKYLIDIQKYLNFI